MLRLVTPFGPARRRHRRGQRGRTIRVTHL